MSSANHQMQTLICYQNAGMCGVKRGHTEMARTAALLQSFFVFMLSVMCVTGIKYSGDTIVVFVMV
jgi:hypothetical protein